MYILTDHDDPQGKFTPPRTETHRPKTDRLVSTRPNISAVKDAADIEDVAKYYGEFGQSSAGRLLGRCVAPDHEDRTPSMTIYADRRTFKCYGCGAHGDVLDLVGLAEGCELWESVLILSQRYGVELPGRPDSWFRKQTRQRAVRKELDSWRVEILRRRLFRLIEPMVREAEEDIREEIARDLWAAMWRRAEHMLLERREEGSS